MASIDRRPGSQPTRVCAPSGALALCWILPLIAMAWSCLPPPPDIQCVESENCNRFSGGACRSAPSGSRWCSYPDAGCPSGHRFSDLDVGDGLASACTEAPGQPRWALQLGGTGWDYGNGITTDGDGNVIAVGTFSNALPVGAITLSSAGGSDAYVIKLNGITGELLWARGIGGVGSETGVDVETDAANNVYVMGDFLGPSDLGGGELHSEGSKDLFVLKLSADGAHVWSRRLGRMGEDLGYDLAVRGDVVAVAGSSSQTFAVANSPFLELAFPTTDIFIVTMTAGGDLLWSKALGGSLWDYARGVTIDSSGNVVFVGYFGGTVNFGGGPLTSMDGGPDIFMVKYTSRSGSLLFARRLGGMRSDAGNAVTVDHADNIIVVGHVSGAADLGGPASLHGLDEDVFVAKYTLAGAHLWARSFRAVSATTNGYQVASAVAVDDAGDVVVTGAFCGTIAFGGAEMSSAASCSISTGSVFPMDVFAVRLAGSGGDYVSSVRVGSRAEPSRISLATEGRPYLIGHFDGFSGIGGHAMASAGDADAFILSLAPL